MKVGILDFVHKPGQFRDDLVAPVLKSHAPTTLQPQKIQNQTAKYGGYQGRAYSVHALHLTSLPCLNVPLGHVLYSRYLDAFLVKPAGPVAYDKVDAGRSSASFVHQHAR
jgi:hypothetical protein